MGWLSWVVPSEIASKSTLKPVFCLPKPEVLCITWCLSRHQHYMLTFSFTLLKKKSKKKKCSHIGFKLEKAMAPHSSTLAWKIPWTEEPGRPQSMRSRRVGHNWATSLSLFTFVLWRRKWQATPVFLPGESQGRRSLVGCHLWQSWTSRKLSRKLSLKRLSSSSRVQIWEFGQVT